MMDVMCFAQCHSEPDMKVEGEVSERRGPFRGILGTPDLGSQRLL